MKTSNKLQFYFIFLQYLHNLKHLKRLKCVKDQRETTIRKKTYLMAHLLPENNYNQGCKSKTIKYKG